MSEELKRGWPGWSGRRWEGNGADYFYKVKEEWDRRPPMSSA